MWRGLSKTSKKELLTTIRDRYQCSSKRDKGRILDEITAATDLHHKHAIRLLAGSEYGKEEETSLPGRRVCDEAVRETATAVWEASDRICRNPCPVYRMMRIIECSRESGMRTPEPGNRRFLRPPHTPTCEHFYVCSEAAALRML